MNDQNFVLSVVTLEEFGATGNKASSFSFPAFMRLQTLNECTCVDTPPTLL